jgi:hypothetical protein
MPGIRIEWAERFATAGRNFRTPMPMPPVHEEKPWDVVPHQARHRLADFW